MLEYFQLFILFILSYIISTPLIVCAAIIYNMYNSFDKSKILMFMFSFSWALFGLWNSLYITLITIFALFVIYFETAKTYYETGKRLLKIILGMSKIIPTNDDLQKDIKDIEYIDDKLEYIENIIEKIKLIPNRIGVCCNDIWKKYSEQDNVKFMTDSYYLCSSNFDLMMDHLKINGHFIWNEIKKCTYVEKILNKFSKYYKLYDMANKPMTPENDLPPKFNLENMNMATMMSDLGNIMESVTKNFDMTKMNSLFELPNIAVGKKKPNKKKRKRTKKMIL